MTPSPTWRRATSAPTRPSTTSSGACARARTSSRRRCTRSTTPARRRRNGSSRLTAAAEEGGATLLVSGVDPGWGNDALAVIAAGLCTRIRSIHCQEIFDYSTYDQPHAVKVLVRIRRPDGRGADDAAAVDPDHGVGRQHPADRSRTRVWRSTRSPKRSSGVPLEASVDTVMGPFEKGTQGAFWLKVIGKSGGRERIVIDHITRIHPSCAPDWPQPDQGAGDHRVIIDGDPAAHAGQPRRRAGRHPGRRRKHHCGQPPARRHRVAGDAEAGHLRRPRRAAFTRRCRPKSKQSAGLPTSARMELRCPAPPT